MDNLLARFQNAFWVVDDHACILQSLQDVGYAVRHLVGGGPQDQNVVQINETQNPSFSPQFLEHFYDTLPLLGKGGEAKSGSLELKYSVPHIHSDEGFETL